MNTLFLDDNLQRLEIAQSNLKEGVFVKTARQSINYLQKEKHWDLIMLDHDLDEEIKDLNITGNGMDVVQWICKNKTSVETIVVHSRNYYASNDMTKALRENEYNVLQIPFFDIDWKEIIGP